uniref:Ig-like domain-containing protein n=1 Tax=Nothobranchius furzeri TaxID=105023 RepID=A0A8C6NX64_NOTFU
LDTKTSSACLQVSPDRSQFFRYDSISLSCEHQLNSTGWKVKRKTPEGGIRPCSTGWGQASSGSSCLIKNTYPTDTGVYWCESDMGERSNSINITITDRPVILESPTLPVSEGAAVTLRCKAATNPSKYNFFKDGRSISSNSSGELIIQSASKSDEGLYSCSVVGLGESLESWMVVSEAVGADFLPAQHRTRPGEPLGSPPAGGGWLRRLGRGKSRYCPRNPTPDMRMKMDGRTNNRFTRK